MCNNFIKFYNKNYAVFIPIQWQSKVSIHGIYLTIITYVTLMEKLFEKCKVYNEV